MHLVSAVVINYQTPDLLSDAVTSFRECYPEVPLDIVDNGSQDDSRSTLERLHSEFPGETRLTLHDRNLFHGPAMDLAMHQAKGRYVYFFDSDTVTRKSGFIERMAHILSGEDTWATGQVATVDRKGFAAEKGFQVPVSAYMMIHRERYLKLPPFQHHGLPVLHTAIAAHELGWKVAPFPMEEFVDHIGRGTAQRFGYGLGWRSRLDYLLHRIGL